MDMNTSVPLTPREAASGLLGSVSMTCWIFLLVCIVSMRMEDCAPDHFRKNNKKTPKESCLIFPRTGPPTNRKLPQRQRGSHFPPLCFRLVRR